MCQSNRGAEGVGGGRGLLSSGLGSLQLPCLAGVPLHPVVGQPGFGPGVDQRHLPVVTQHLHNVFP